MPPEVKILQLFSVFSTYYHLAFIFLSYNLFPLLDYFPSISTLYVFLRLQPKAKAKVKRPQRANFINSKIFLFLLKGHSYSNDHIIFEIFSL